MCVHENHPDEEITKWVLKINTHWNEDSAKELHHTVINEMLYCSFSTGVKGKIFDDSERIVYAMETSSVCVYTCSPEWVLLPIPHSRPTASDIQEMGPGWSECAYKSKDQILRTQTNVLQIHILYFTYCLCNACFLFIFYYI